MAKKLSKQQSRRIVQQHQRKLDGMNVADAAIVVSHLGYQAVVLAGNALLAADWRRAIGDIAVNDRVLIAEDGMQHAVIEAVFPRGKTLYKKQGRKVKAVASHVDQLMVMVAVKPRWQAGLIDRYLVAASNAGIDVAIACNKIDLLDAEAEAGWQNMLDIYAGLGVHLIPLSVAQGAGLSEVQAWLHNKQTVICGQSGVGKSSLISTLIPDCHIWTQHISAISELGRHTTTNARRYPLPDGGAVIDTPGVRGFAVSHLERSDIIAGFHEIAVLTKHCHFRDCTHRHEPNCAVLAALSAGVISGQRYASMMQILEE